MGTSAQARTSTTGRRPQSRTSSATGLQRWRRSWQTKTSRCLFVLLYEYLAEQQTGAVVVAAAIVVAATAVATMVEIPTTFEVESVVAAESAAATLT